MRQNYSCRMAKLRAAVCSCQAFRILLERMRRSLGLSKMDMRCYLCSHPEHMTLTAPTRLNITSH